MRPTGSPAPCREPRASRAQGSPLALAVRWAGSGCSYGWSLPHEAAVVPGGDQPLVGVRDVGRDVLGDGEPACGVSDDALEVTDDHVDDELVVADGLQVLVEGDVL